jgi:hypothetical protein
VRRASRECRVATVVDSGMVMGKAGRGVSERSCTCGESGGWLTVSGEVLDEDLHGLLGLCGRGAVGDAGDAVGTHVCGGCKVVAVMSRVWYSYPIKGESVNGWSGESGCSGGVGVAKWQQLGVGGEEE